MENEIRLKTLCFLLLLWMAPGAKAEPLDRLQEILVCVAEKRPGFLFDRQAFEPTWTIALEDERFFVTGTLGWHASWVILFDMRPEPPLAYMTFAYGHEGSRAFGRRKVPRLLRYAVSRCGTSWQGVWVDNWPEKKFGALPDGSSVGGMPELGEVLVP